MQRATLEVLEHLKWMVWQWVWTGDRGWAAGGVLRQAQPPPMSGRRGWQPEIQVQGRGGGGLKLDHFVAGRGELLQRALGAVMGLERDVHLIPCRDSSLAFTSLCAIKAL